MANVLITGCSSGFGLLAALEFTRRGDNVFATMRNVSKARALNDAAEAEGLKVNVVALDVTDDASVRAAVDSVVAEAGTIDILVNNAGVELIGAIHLLSDEEALWQLDTNVLGPLRTIRAVVPLMLQQGAGTIVNVSSVAGRVSVPYTGMYAASKHALEAMTEAMVYELSHRGIRMALIEPGQFATEFGGNARHAAAMATDEEAESRRLKFRETMGALLPADREPPDPRTVALAIVDTAHAGAPKLQVPVGADADMVIGARSSMDFESFEQAMRQVLNWYD
jgi:NAD(P)-dependent dehydrogenase (short-subunit alcohol dehydrogenase family)